MCVEVFRALRVSLTCNDLCDILSRLVETVAEQGEDMQVRLDSPVYSASVTISVHWVEQPTVSTHLQLSWGHILKTS